MRDGEKQERKRINKVQRRVSIRKKREGKLVRH